MDLCTDFKLTEKFKNLDTQKKTAFTRTYNKAHKEITAVKKGKGAATKIVAEESEGEESVDSMLDEEEIDAILKGRAQEKEYARQNKALKAVGKLTMIKASLNDEEDAPKGKAAKKKKAKGKAKTKAPKKNAYDDMDSLDDFIVDSDDDGPKKKAKSARR